MSSLSRIIALCAIAVLLIAGGAGLWFGSIQPDAARQRADPDNSSLVAEGATIYRQQCAVCHGAKLEGQPAWRERKPDGKLPAPPHDETGHTWHHGDEVLFRLTKQGVRPPMAPKGYLSDMPAFGGVLTDAQIWAVLAFIKSEWPPEIRQRQERINEAIQQRQRERTNLK